MVSPERLASLRMAGDVGAATVNGHGPKLDLTPMCGCGKPTSHKGMCTARWAKRRDRAVAAQRAPKDFDFGAAIVADRDRMLRMAMSWTRNNKAQAEDLVSQAAINILENQDKFIIGSNFAAWSTTIIKNLFYGSKRRAKDTTSITQESPDGDEFEVVDGALTTVPTQESAIVAQEMARTVLEETTDKQREALLRVNMDGQSLEEAAAGMGVPEGTIKSLMSRGRDRLDPERKARVIPAVNRQNADSLDFVLQKLRDERDRITQAIAALEQCRTIFTKAA